jgi:HEPN domain-containing protein
MDESPFTEAARAWIVSGNHDLRSAQALIALDPPETGTTAFHAQQAAEKYLKALLAFHGEDPPRTHDLVVLLDLVLRYEETMENYRYESRMLIPFAVQVRYPFSGPPPTPEEAAKALAAASIIYRAVLDLVNV